MDKNCNIEKTYCLYASDWHLTIMLLPFISKKLYEKDRVFMKFENSIEEKMKQLTNKLGFKNKDEINDIRWGMEINDDDESDNEKLYIVAGSKEYMEEMNRKIAEYYNDKDTKVKVINCFNIVNDTDNCDAIGNGEYHSVLTTSGENVIS